MPDLFENMKAVNLVKVVGHVKVATPVFNRLKGHLYFLQVVFVSLWIKCSWSGIQSKQRLIIMPFRVARETFPETPEVMSYVYQL